jgi:hypothetical protein
VRPNARKRILVWVVSAVAASVVALLIEGTAMVQSQETPPHTPPIQAEQKTDSPLKSGSDPNQQAKPLGDILPGHPTSEPHANAGDRENATHAGSDEATEYWTVFGRRLKITDSLLALFTFFLFVSNCILFYSAEKAADAAKASADSVVIVERPYIFMTTPKGCRWT